MVVCCTCSLGVAWRLLLLLSIALIHSPAFELYFGMALGFNVLHVCTLQQMSYVILVLKNWTVLGTFGPIIFPTKLKDSKYGLFASTPKGTVAVNMGFPPTSVGPFFISCSILNFK